jgi:hypothetical protein
MDMNTGLTGTRVWPSFFRGWLFCAMFYVVALVACFIAHLLLPTERGEVNLGARFLCVLAEASASGAGGFFAARLAGVHPFVVGSVALILAIPTLDGFHLVLDFLLDDLSLETFSIRTLGVNLFVVMIPGMIGVLAGFGTRPPPCGESSPT